VDLAKYAALFLAESREHLQACNRLLLAWEREPAATEPVAGLFRAVHSIKGMAATMGYAGIAELAHRAETLLDAIRAGRVAARPAHFELLFRAVDALEAGVEGTVAGRAPGAAADELARLLEAAAGAPGRAAAAPPRPPVTAAPAGPALQVEVVVRGDAPLRGARATLALARVAALGTVSRATPGAAALERDDFDGRFAFRLATVAAPAEVDAAIRAAGDIADVRIEFAADEAPVGTAARRQVRVELGRLDAMMKLAGELVVARNRLLDLLPPGDAELRRTGERIARIAGELHHEVLEARMTPVREAFDRFPRTVRDLARDLGKQVRLELEGGEIELDRAVLDELGDPLVHLVRNAVDHGIEPPAERAAAGKPPEGRLRLVAVRERASVAIRVADDGRGIDRARVLERARREGLVEPGVTALSDDQVLRVLSRAGFSTAPAVSGVSGRGVGVDVVVTRLRQLGGAVELQTVPAQGTTWTLRVPLTLAIVRALLLETGGERYAVPLSYVAETVDCHPAAVVEADGRAALLVRERAVPLVELGALFRAPAGPAARKRPAVVLQVGERRAAVVVDALVGQQDIVVEPFDAPAGTPPWFGGATILPDGAPALILDAAALA
jgi:two-component system chemotaxis sensor kinase CheA